MSTLPRSSPRAFPDKWQGAHIGVLGLARSGLALARVLGALGAHVLVSDARPESAILAAAAEARQLGAQVETGGHSEALYEVDLLIISPGVSVHSAVVQTALQRGIPVAGEVEIAYRLCKLPLIAVTGTNGKSTTCDLVQGCLEPRSLLAGNIGVPLVSEVSGDLSAYDWIVAEISSFQLETIHRFSPRISVLTNITPDHLDRHRTMEEYVAAKCRLFSRQGVGDCAVFNHDDEWAARSAEWLESKTLPPWLEGFEDGTTPAHGPTVYRYSTRGPVERGCYFEDGAIYFVSAGQRQKLVDWDFPGLPGPHNRSNAVAAALVARLAGVSNERIAQVFAGYGRLHHRLELAGTIDEIRFIDDSKATNVSSVEAALQTYREPVVLIAGGRDKGLDLDLLGQVIARHAHALVVIGEASQAISSAARRHGLSTIEAATTMEDAVERAYKLCPAPGVVLLSPACTSFDMFNNAEHRGDVFAASVNSLQRRLDEALMGLGEEGA